MFTVQYPRLLFALPITRTFQFRLPLKVRVIGSRLYITSTLKWHIDLLKTWSSKGVIFRVFYNVFKLCLFFQTYEHVRWREVLLWLLRLNWQKVANQTCVSRFTKKLMIRHISRRARKNLTVKASELLLSVQTYPHFLGGEMRENLHHLHRPG